MKLSTRLLRWYDKEGRNLPWRHTKDPYRILVSEVMLQQTQVERVLLYYKEWIRRFPNWRVLAYAARADVLRAWAGLGYNRRAVMLHELAYKMFDRTFCTPTSVRDWGQLKGVGSYTARAVALFSGQEVDLPIDTNIRRILGRLLLNRFYATPRSDPEIRKSAQALLDSTSRPADLVQALFDLAASVCTKRPNCDMCPLKDVCPAARAFLEGRVRTPRLTTRQSNERVRPGKKHPDRIYRGRILKMIRESTHGMTCEQIVRSNILYATIGDRDWVEQMLHRMEKDGLIRRKGGRYIL